MPGLAGVVLEHKYKYHSQPVSWPGFCLLLMQNTKYVLAKRPFEAIKSFVDFISYNLGHVPRVSPHWSVGGTL